MSAARRVVSLLGAITALLSVASPAAVAANGPGRAYELVSPSAKNGNDVVDQAILPGTFPPIARSDGQGVILTALGGFPGSISNGAVSTYAVTRTDHDWDATPLSPPQNPAAGPLTSTFAAFAPDFGRAVLTGAPEPPLAPGAAEGTPNLYLLDRGAGSFQTLSLGAPEHERGFEVEYISGSADLGHVVFRTNNAPLTADSPAGVPLLYEWDAAAPDSIRLVGREPGTDLPIAGVEIARAANGFRAATPSAHTVSSDGSRVFFTSQADGQPYVRLNGTSTEQLSKSQATVPDPNGAQASTFWDASTDGSVAYFSSPGKLTDDATTGPTDGGNDLYRFDVATEALTDIAVDAADPNGAEVAGVLGASEDGSRVYFAARGVLAPGGALGQDNIYLWTDDGSLKGTVSFVSGGGQAVNWEGLPTAFPLRAPARVTADGEHLLFESNSNLTGYESEGHYEAYLYDTASGEVSCASCNPTGAPATADAEAIGVGDVPQQARTLSADGRTVFFTTAEALSPQDVNGVADIYEYDSTSGQVDLVSAGTGDTPSVFADADADGRDVFFTTRQPLVGVDTDENLDVYDARVGGGLPSQNEAPSPPPCAGQECQGPPPPPPPQGTPQSSTFAGPGNARPHRHRKHRHHRRHGHHPSHRIVPLRDRRDDEGR